MPLYESEEYTREKLEKLRRRNKCATCGAPLNVYLDIQSGKAFLACWDWHRTHHDGGIIREASRYETGGLAELNILTRREIMTNQFGKERTMALEKYHSVVSLSQAQAKEILQTIFPEAPEVEMKRAVLLCASYQLNPLMGHVFLIPFKGRDKTSWATVIGIKAKRLLASRKRVFSYLDDSPRVMTEKEQVKVFGKVDAEYIVAITVLEDPSTGATARGYGKWERGKEPYGTDKGNSSENMAFIRSESQALDRLCPGEMPTGIGVVDEQFVAESKTKVISVEAPDNLEADIISDASESKSSPVAEESNGNLPKRDPATLKNIGELRKALLDDFGIKSQDQLAELNLKDWSELSITPAEAYLQVAASRK